jgi:beta-glucanase (GH16 family)
VKSLFGASCAMLLGAGAAAFTALEARGQEPSRHVPKGYRLVWSDEFDGKLLDVTKWTPRGVGPRKGGVTSPANAFVDGEGHLIIETNKVGNEYHTGMISTQKSFLTAYGYFEARVRLPTQGGQVSAFWLQSPDNTIRTADAKSSGTEIDIVEFYRGRLGSRADNAIHWGGYGDQHKFLIKRFPFESGPNDWHVFSLSWTPDRYIFYADGRETWRTKEAVSHVPQYIILSTIISAQPNSIARAHLPDQFKIDYVRVYKPVLSIDDEPNAR